MSTYSNFYLQVAKKVLLDCFFVLFCFLFFFFLGGGGWKDTDNLNHKHLDAKRRSEINSYTNFLNL